MNNNLAQFTSELIEVFEDFLDNRNIVLENDEKEESEDAANIYGSDYGELQTGIEDVLLHHNIDLNNDNNYIISLDIPKEEEKILVCEFIKDSIETGFNMADIETKVISVNKIK